MSYRYIFQWRELPILQADKQHWRVRSRYRKQWHERVAGMVMAQRAKPKEPLRKAEIVCVRYSSASKHPDRTNLSHSFKPIIDGLVKAGVLIDDSPEVLVEESYRWVKVPRDRQCITVMVTSAERAEVGSP